MTLIKRENCGNLAWVSTVVEKHAAAEMLRGSLAMDHELLNRSLDCATCIAAWQESSITGGVAKLCTQVQYELNIRYATSFARNDVKYSIDDSSKTQCTMPPMSRVARPLPRSLLLLAFQAAGVLGV